jgi:hypothetical protein
MSMLCSSAAVLTRSVGWKDGPSQHVLYRSVFSSQESLCVGMQEVP